MIPLSMNAPPRPWTPSPGMLRETPEPPSWDAAGLAETYARHISSRLHDKLHAIRCDKVYHRASGDYLFYREGGEEVKVLDLVGGYGCNFLGHNHPGIVQACRESFDQGAPVFAQASIKNHPSRLAERLSAAAGIGTDRRFKVRFTNSGAESIEAAFKHALMEHAVRLEEYRESAERSGRQILEAAGAGSAPRLSRVGADIASNRLGRSGFADAAELVRAVREYNEPMFRDAPIFLAFEKGFHGKTLGAVNLTSNPGFRKPFDVLGTPTLFLDNRLEAWQTALADLRKIRLVATPGSDGGVVLEEAPHFQVAGVFFEPIQGEGGVHPVEIRIIEFLQAMPDRRFPIIADEIQTGMGRTGHFLASRSLGLACDYYALGKSLGGGICKIGAVLIEAGRYEEDFSLAHSSTFGEDELSGRVGLKVMDILEADGASAPKMAGRKGAHLLGELRRIQREFPDVIADVRGQGLMIGIEFRPPETSGSWFLKVLGEEGYFGYLLSGHFLNRHSIRILPTLSNTHTLRLQPSYRISAEAIWYFLACLEETCQLLRKQNFSELGAHIAGIEGAGRAADAADFRDIRFVKDESDQRAKVAFIGHLIRPEHLKLRDASLGGIPDDRMKAFYASTYDLFSQGSLYESVNIRSASGREVNFNFIGLYLTSETISAAMRAKDLDWINRRIYASVAMARDAGCRTIGFGGFSSITTANCTAVPCAGIGLTSGNSLTVGMAIEAILQACRERGLDLAKARLGVVGAAGNIGSAYAEIISDHVGKVLLLGQKEGRKRLERLGQRILKRAVDRLDGSGRDAGGIASALAADSALAPRIKAGLGDPLLPARLWESMAARPERSLVEIATDLASLRGCDLLVLATNSPQPLVYPEHLRGGAVVCDISVPLSVHESVLRLEDVHVLQGGLVRLPCNPDFRIGGVPNPPGITYACISETILLGLEGHEGNFSYGSIEVDKVARSMALAEKHGFKLASPKLENSY